MFQMHLVPLMLLENIFFLSMYSDRLQMLRMAKNL